MEIDPVYEYWTMDRVQNPIVLRESSVYDEISGVTIFLPIIC
jgi:hypothetical protein